MLGVKIRVPSDSPDLWVVGGRARMKSTLNGMQPRLRRPVQYVLLQRRQRRLGRRIAHRIRADGIRHRQRALVEKPPAGPAPAPHRTHRRSHVFATVTATAGASATLRPRSSIAELSFATSLASTQAGISWYSVSLTITSRTAPAALPACPWPVRRSGGRNRRSAGPLPGPRAGRPRAGTAPSGPAQAGPLQRELSIGPGTHHDLARSTSWVPGPSGLYCAGQEAAR